MYKLKANSTKIERKINWCTSVRRLLHIKMASSPSVHHALVVVFLEFFSWGLLTSPMITALNDTFPNHTFLMNGMVAGVKGLLSFLSAPLIGALSDKWGRRSFLLVTVIATCAPIPFMAINKLWFFVMIALSGLFSVTFSVVFAYVADVTSEQERSSAYGLVSATFAASLVTSPALGSYLSGLYGDTLVVFVATLTALADVLFIIFCVPESLTDKLKPNQSNLWESFDPFSSLKKAGQDKMILLICMAVFLSYLPEAGQYSCFFVYLRLVIGFSPEDVALFIAVVGLLSVIAQTFIMSFLIRVFNAKSTIMIGLFLEAVQLFWYGFGTQVWMMWMAGALAAVASITYPAISSYVSTHAGKDKQGVVQGMITGIRGLCNGLGPALFGIIFSLFHVDLSHVGLSHPVTGVAHGSFNRSTSHPHLNTAQFNSSFSLNSGTVIPGPPFVFGSLLVFLAMMVTAFIPQLIQYKSKFSDEILGFGESSGKRPSGLSKSSYSNYYYTNIETSVVGGGGNGTRHQSACDGDGGGGGCEKSDLKDEGYIDCSLTTPVSPCERSSSEIETRLRGKSVVTCEVTVPLIGASSDDCM